MVGSSQHGGTHDGNAITPAQSAVDRPIGAVRQSPSSGTAPVIESVSTLSPVEQTQLLPVWGRAAFTRIFPSFVDPRAVEAVHRLDYDFAKVQRAIGDFGWVAWGYRAYRIDGICREFLERHPDGLVINLGAGLDALFERIDNGRVDCYSVDLASTIALRAVLFPSSERNHYLVGNVTDGAWLEGVPGHRPMIVVLSGVTMYLSAATLERLFHRLRAAGCQRPVEVVADVYSPAAVLLTNWRIRRTGLPDARITFGCWSVRTFHRWVPGLRVLQDELLVRGLGSLGLIRAMDHFTRLQLLLCRITRFARLYHLAFPLGPAS